MRNKALKIVIALILFIIALTINFNNETINNIIFVISYLIVGLEILKEAIENIFKGEIFDENFLMSLATIGAFAIGEFPEAVAVMLFYQVGEFFQDYAVDKSRKSISSLMDIRPDFANVLRNGEIKKVNPSEVNIGETIVVKPGEKVPLDGKIIEGQSSLDTKDLTGETLPRDAKEGDTVLSGCINMNGLIKIKVAKAFGESTVSKILDLVENASNKKSKSENFITKFSKYYTPTVVIIALLLAVIPPLVIDGATFSDWIYRALSFLVVSCPCALVISIPLSFFGGIGGASKIGVLIKGSNYLEALADTEIVVFDKTGTLTKGVFEVQKVSPVGISAEKLLQIAAYAENYSNHPISKSIKEAYNNANSKAAKVVDDEIHINTIDKSKIISTQEISGLGIVAQIGERNVLVGNEKLMNENHINFTKTDDVGTVLHVAIDGVYAGYILIADKIKDDSAEAIEELKKDKISQIVMLTGDRKEVGDAVAKQLGISKVYAELLPAGKVEKVEQLMKTKSEKGKLAFVGDGINDAPVLALADIGIAMGGLGSDAAIEAADIVIMTDEPSKISKSINLSKRTMRIVKENIIFAITVKILVLILSAFGISTLWQAVFADVGVSIIAVFNALRVLRVKNK